MSPLARMWRSVMARQPPWHMFIEAERRAMQTPRLTLA